MKDVIEKLKEFYRLSNFYHTSMAVIRYIIRPVIHWEKIIVLEKEILSTPKFVKNKNIKFFDIDQHNIEQLDNFKVEKLDIEYLRKKLSEGDIVNLVLDGNKADQVLGFGLMNFEHMYVSNIKIKLSHKLMYSAFSTTFPEARGRGLHASLLEHKSSRGYQRGREKCLGDIFHHNKSARKGNLKAGFEKIGCIRSYDVFKRWKILVCKPSLINYIQGTEQDNT